MNVVIGIDINEYEIQVSYLAREVEEAEPVTLKLASSPDKTNVETAICKRADVNQWYYGADAVKKGVLGQGTLVEHLWKLLSVQETILLDGSQFEVAKLCNLFLKQVVRVALQKIAEELEVPQIMVDAMVVTAEPMTKAMTEKMDVVLEGLAVEREKIFYQTHEESLFQYLSHQPKRLNGYETGVFDLTSEEMIAYRIEMNHRTKPIVTTVKRIDVPAIVRKKHYESIMIHDRALEQLDYDFRDFVDEFVAGRLVTTCYLVGDGFLGDWCKESLKSLCRNRKVFAGNNLYSKGAVYSGMQRLSQDEELTYIFLGGHMLKSNIGVSINTKEQEQYEALLDAGTNWYEAKSELECLIEGTDNLALLITPVDSGRSYTKEISLASFASEQEHPYYAKIMLEMKDSTTVIVTIYNQGFGSFYAPNPNPIQCEIRLEEE